MLGVGFARRMMVLHRVTLSEISVVTLKTVYPSLYLSIYLSLIYFERQTASWGGTEREGERESQAGSVLSTGSEAGPELKPRAGHPGAPQWLL